MDGSDGFYFFDPVDFSRSLASFLISRRLSPCTIRHVRSRAQSNDCFRSNYIEEGSLDLTVHELVDISLFCESFIRKGIKILLPSFSTEIKSPADEISDLIPVTYGIKIEVGLIGDMENVLTTN